MNYWLICLPREDIEHCMNLGTFGLSRKHIVNQVKKGDSVLCCAGKGDWKVIGTGAATSDYYLSVDKVFLKDDYFPDRFDFTSTLLSADDELDLKPILSELNFVKDLKYWAVFFRNGIVKLTEEDYLLIRERIS